MSCAGNAAEEAPVCCEKGPFLKSVSSFSRLSYRFCLKARLWALVAPGQCPLAARILHLGAVRAIRGPRAAR